MSCDNDIQVGTAGPQGPAYPWRMNQVIITLPSNAGIVDVRCHGYAFGPLQYVAFSLWHSLITVSS